MGGFLEKIKSVFAMPAEDSSSGFITFTVKCKRCGEEIQVKVRKDSELSRVFEDEGPAGAEYFLRKEILGEKCNNLIYVDIYFGPTLSIISKEIKGGEFAG
jgi:hypothetical protein